MPHLAECRRGRRTRSTASPPIHWRRPESDGPVHGVVRTMVRAQRVRLAWLSRWFGAG